MTVVCKVRLPFFIVAIFLLVTSFPLCAPSSVHATSTYSSNANLAAQWLVQNQNIDGSWGASEDVKIPYTVEAVMALRALNLYTPAYYWGVTWLENHNPPNVDFKARRLLSLSAHGDTLQADLTYLKAAQSLAALGNSGWGLTPEYQGTSLDSAFALLALSSQGDTSNVQAALNYLKSSQLAGSDKGWSVAQESTSDPMTTSFVIQALYGCRGVDTSVLTYLPNGIASLSASVGTGSPAHLQALASLTYLTTGYPANATPLLNSLAIAQSSNGSWSQDIYATALAARAMAEFAGGALNTIVVVPDLNLRKAINLMLGKNSMDALNRGDLANLVSLSAPGMGIVDLTGLEWAVNLTFADLRDNKITSIAPLSGLVNLTVLTTGNPIGSPDPVCSNSPVRLLGKTFHTTIQSAYDAAEDGDVIQTNAESTGTLGMNRPVSVTLGGGFTCDYGANSEPTVINGSMTISGGTIWAGNFRIRGATGQDSQGSEDSAGMDFPVYDSGAVEPDISIDDSSTETDH